MIRALFILLTLCNLVACLPSTKDLKPVTEVTACPGQLDAQSAIWSQGFGLNEDNTRFQTTSAITRQNIQQLKLLYTFVYPFKNPVSSSQSPPAVTEEAIIVGDIGGWVRAIDRTRGCEIWKTKTEGGLIHSGFTLGQVSPDQRTIFFSSGAELYALDYETGDIHWHQQYETHDNAYIRATPVYHAGKVYIGYSSNELVLVGVNPFKACCTFQGSVTAVDARTGQLIWQRKTMDQPPTKAYPADKVTGPAGAPVWGTPTIDAKRNQLLVPTGQQYSGPYTDRSDAILALDLDTGQLKWQFQATQRDIYNASCDKWLDESQQPPEKCDPDYVETREDVKDWDFGSSPVVVRNRQGQELVLAGQKSGVVWAISPDDGRVIWQTKVGVGGGFGGIHWGLTVDQSANRVYVPVSDLCGLKSEKMSGVKFIVSGNRDSYYTGVWGQCANAKPGLYALDMNDGRVIWQNTKPYSKQGVITYPIMSAPTSAVSDIVFGGYMNGDVRAFDSRTGNVLWQYDTNVDSVLGINGIQGDGGSIDGNGGPIVAGNMVLVNSGYPFGEAGPGNIMMVFGIQ